MVHKSVSTVQISHQSWYTVIRNRNVFTCCLKCPQLISSVGLIYILYISFENIGYFRYIRFYGVFFIFLMWHSSQKNDVNSPWTTVSNAVWMTWVLQLIYKAYKHTYCCLVVNFIFEQCMCKCSTYIENIGMIFSIFFIFSKLSSNPADVLLVR